MMMIYPPRLGFSYGMDGAFSVCGSGVLRCGFTRLLVVVVVVVVT